MYRDKLFYAHSRFSKTTFEVSPAQNITSTPDDLLDNFEKRESNLKSSFLIKKNEKYLVALLNPKTDKIELYSLANDKKP